MNRIQPLRIFIRVAGEGVNESESSNIPLLEKEGWLRPDKKVRSDLFIKASRCRACASREPQTGAKRERDSAKHEKWSVQNQLGLCLTTLYVSRYRAHASRPSAAIAKGKRGSAQH